MSVSTPHPAEPCRNKGLTVSIIHEVSHLPEKQHQGLQESLEVIVSINGSVIVQCNISKYLGGREQPQNKIQTNGTALQKRTGKVRRDESSYKRDPKVEM